MSALEDKLRRATDRIAQLTEQIQVHEKQENARTSRIKSTEKNMREICEKILAKRSTEMKLGQAYAWDNIDIDQLLQQTKEAYNEIEKEQKNTMLRLLRKIDELNGAKESLTAQIIRIKQNPTNIPENPNEVKKRAADEKKQKNKDNKTSSKTSARTSQEKTGQDTSSRTDPIIVEDSYDALNAFEEEAVEDAITQKQKMKPVTSQTIQTKRSKKTKEKVASISKKIESQVAVVKLGDYEKHVTDIGWALIQVMGESGLSVYSEIEPEVININKSWSQTAVRTNLLSLRGANICIYESLRGLPVQGKMNLAYLTPDIGQALYEAKFNKKPAEPECLRIVKEHDNYEHGYGIKAVYDILHDSGHYTSVNMFHRKGNAINSDNNQKYIPDITVQDKAGTTYYIEYELGNTLNTDFNSKCSKIANITSIINIVTPNKQVSQDIKKQVDAWVKNRGIKALSGIKVRIAPVLSLKSPDKNDKSKAPDIRSDKNWEIVYDLTNGIEPIQYF